MKVNEDLWKKTLEFPPITKYVAWMEKKCVKLIYSIKINIITSFFSEFLVKFLRISIKYVVSRAVSGALKFALLREMTIQNRLSDDFFEWR